MRKQKKAGQGAIIRRVLAYIKPYRIQVGSIDRKSVV